MLSKCIYRFIFASLLLVTSSANLYAQSCNGRPYCKDIRSCNEALYYLEVCGYGKLDRDKDGIPCESICGKRLTSKLKSMKQALKLKGENTALGLISQPAASFQCGTKKSCREMVSCKEAKFFMNKCGLKHLDGDKDGQPCNRLCKMYK